MFETMKQQEVIIPLHQDGPDMGRAVTWPDTYYGFPGSQIVQPKGNEIYMREMHELRMAALKAEIKEDAKLNAYAKKRRLKEEDEERRRGLHEDIEVTQEGKIQAITRNLSVAAEPRSIINMQKPSITVLKRLADPTEQIYLLNCVTNGCEKKIFLDTEKSGNGSYLVKKLGSAGVCFKVNKIAESKVLAVKLLCVLLDFAREEFLSDCVGWYMMPGGHPKFTGEEEKTWNHAKKQSW